MNRIAVLLTAALSIAGAARAQLPAYHELYVFTQSMMYYVGHCQAIDNGPYQWTGAQGQIRLNCPYLPAGTPVAPTARTPPLGMGEWDFVVTVGDATWMGEHCTSDYHVPNTIGGYDTVLHCPAAPPPDRTGRHD